MKKNRLFSYRNFGRNLIKLFLLFVLIGSGVETFAQSDDFESATLDTVKWKVRNNSHQGFIINGPSPSGSKHLRVNGAGNVSHSNHMYQQFAPINPKEISWYVKMDTVAVGASGYIVVGDSALATNSGACVVFAYINTTGTPLNPVFTVFANSTVSYNQPYIVGTWLKVEVKNINYTTRRFELWVNDTLRNDTFPFRSPSLNNVSYVRTYTLSNSLVYKLDKFVIKSVPGLSTTSPASITTNSATLGGNVLDSGETATSERGIVYGTAPNPTTANTKVQIGNGLGAFSQNITGLTSNTKYYVRAYAINLAGTGYGPMDSFTTAAGISPSIAVTGTLNTFTSCSGSVSAVDSFTFSGSNLTGNIAISTPSGFEISTSPTLGFGNNLFFSRVSDSVATTKIYVRLNSSATGNPTGNISFTSTGATTQTLAVSGTVNPASAPTITFHPVVRTITTGTSFSIPYTAISGNSHKFSVFSSNPLPLAGFSDLIDAAVEPSQLIVNIPVSLTNAYNFTLRLKDTVSGCTSNIYPFQLAVHEVPAAPQLTVTTVPPVDVSNGQAGITFNVHAKDTVTITGISLAAAIGTITDLKVWYKKSAINGTPSFGTSNGWILVDSVPSIIIDSIYDYPNLKSIPLSFGIVIPKGDTFGIFLTATSGNLKYKTFVTGTQSNFTDSTITIRTGTNEGYGVALNNGLFSFRQFPGSVTYVKGANLPPTINNNTIAAAQSICSGTTANTLIGSTPTGSSGYNYSWLKSTTSSSAGFGTASGKNDSIHYTPGILTQTSWYKRVVNAGTNTDTSAAIEITVNALPTISVGSINSVLATATSFNITYSSTTGSPNQYSIVTGTPNAMPSFAAVNNATLSSSPISVTIPASVANVYNFNLTVKNTTTGCISSAIPLALTVNNPEPTISISGTMGTFAACSGSPSAIDSITVSGTYLTANISMNAPTGFEISTDATTGFGNSLSLTQSAGSVGATKIYVRLSSSATGSPSGNIVLYSSGDNSAVVAVSGTVNPIPTITLGTIANVLPSATSFDLIYVATTGSPNQYSIVTGTPTAMPSFAAVNNATLGSSPISVTIPASTANMYNFILTTRNSLTGCSSANVPFTVTVQNPEISNNTISGNQVVCSGALPASIIGSIADGGTPPIQYLWISSTTDSVNGFGSANGINNQSDYMPAVTLQKTWLRRIAFDANYTDTSNAALIDVKSNPAKPVISIQAASPICQGAEYLNFGAATEAPSGVTYTWTAENAIVYAQGSTKQYALVSFPNSGTAVVILTANQNGCTNDTQVTYTVSAENAPIARVRYFNKNFVCEANLVNKYQWGYDMQPSLEGASINGEINQNYYNASPEFGSKNYWVISSTGTCYQKTYYNQPLSLQPINQNSIALMVYPNPVDNQLLVQAKGAKGSMQVQVLDMHGKICQEVFSVQTETTVNMDGLAPGVYLVRCVLENDMIVNTKVVKN